MDKWQQDFLKSTGFGNTSPKVHASPPSKARQSPEEFENFFHAGQKKPPHGPIPNTVTTENQPLLPGKMPVVNSTGVFQKPFPVENVLLGKDGSVPTYPTQQTGWQSPGIGNVVPQSLVDTTQSKIIPGSVAKSGYKLITDLGGIAKEKLSLASTKDRISLILILCAVVSGLGYIFRRGKRSKEPVIWVIIFFLFAVLAALSHFTNLFYTSEKQTAQQTTQGANKTIDQVMLHTDHVDPKVQLRDMTDFNPYPAPQYRADGIDSRFAYQKTDTAKLEGPRKDIGYYRGDPTPDGMPVLKENELMRNAAQWNMDPGTFNEYMRRLNGESIPQVVQSHPYYAVNAAFEERQQINDPETIYGIGDQPSQSTRKFPYKEPRLQQAGAKTMHTKNPPPGAVRPIEKVHPWMEKEEPSGPAIIADSMLESSDSQFSYSVEERENQEGVANVGGDSSLHQNMDDVFNNPVEKSHRVVEGDHEASFSAQFGQSSQANEEIINSEVSDKPMKQRSKKLS